MKNSKINNERLIASSIAAAILAITGSTIFIGVTTVTNASNIADATTAIEATTAAPNRVNNGEITVGTAADFLGWLCDVWPWCCPPLCWSNSDNQGNSEQEIVYQEKIRSVAIAPSKKPFLI